MIMMIIEATITIVMIIMTLEKDNCSNISVPWQPDSYNHIKVLTVRMCSYRGLFHDHEKRRKQ